jgi:hypothetical protein
VFLNLLGAAEGALIRAAASTQAFCFFASTMKTALLSTLFLLTVFAASAKACDCVSARPNAFAELQDSDAVFVGYVQGVKEVEVPYKKEPGTFTIELEVKLRVEKQLKGQLPGTVFVRTSAGCCACGYQFEVGEKYLVYANGTRRKLGTNSCTRTKPLSYAQKDLVEIEQGREQKKTKSKQIQEQNTRLERTRHQRASLLSCVGEPLKPALAA